MTGNYPFGRERPHREGCHDAQAQEAADVYPAFADTLSAAYDEVFPSECAVARLSGGNQRRRTERQVTQPSSFSYSEMSTTVTV